MPSKSRVYFYGKRLASERRKLGKTQEVFADDVGITQSELSQYENEKQGCYVSKAKRIVDFLGKSFEYLVQLDKLENEKEEISQFPSTPLQKTTKSTYEVHFKNISDRYSDEFGKLKNWIKLKAIDIKQSKFEGRNVKVENIYNTIKNRIKSGHNVLITGDSGAGKTSISLKLFKHFENGYLKSNNNPKVKIPIFIKLSKIKNNTLNEIIFDIINKDIFKQDKERYVIILDGLNEAGNYDKQQNAIEQICDFSGENKKICFIITSQSLSIIEDSLDSFTQYNTLPFESEDIINYMIKFKYKFKTKKEAEKFYNEINDVVKEFISIPIFLNIMVSTYQKDSYVKINNPGELLKEYEKFLCGSRKGKRRSMVKRYRNRVIPFIFYNMCKDSMIELEWDELNKYIKKYNSDFSCSINEGEIEDIITNRFSIMKCDENDNLRFEHQTIRDYFAAVYMQNKKMSSDKIFNDVFKDSVKNEDLVNAVKLLVGIESSEISKAIIQKFVDKDPYLAATLFAWSSIDTFEENFIDYYKIDIDLAEYFINLNELVLFYLKVLDLLKMANKLDEIISAYYNMDLGNIYFSKRDHNSAIKYYKKAIFIYEKKNIYTHPDYAHCHMNLGLVYFNKYDYNSAIKYYKKAISIYEKNNMHAHPGYVHSHVTIGLLYYRKLDYNSTIKYYKKAISIYEKNNMHAHPDYAHCYMRLGLVYIRKYDYKIAIEYCKKAFSIYEQTEIFSIKV